ncbi:MAG: nucleotide sugar dehydrogenase [Rhodobacteraceae bacterium]|nr:nucleotide sugar dehydrogenase [Paracoccaceae bacterium]
MGSSAAITVVGLGYVGMSLAALLARHHDVTAFDIDQDKVVRVNAGLPIMSDAYLEDTIARETLSLSATTDPETAYQNADYIIIAVPTNYCDQRQCFDTSVVENVIVEARQYNSTATIVIKSTVPVGFSEQQKIRRGDEAILFSPEFLRESHAFFDSQHPSRIIVGGPEDKARAFAKILSDASLDRGVSIYLTGLSEAESIKLFSNAYLAMRVAYFNQIDTFCMEKELNAQEIIEGVCLDPRIGAYYNNPSFGYGGSCLPKDMKQLLADHQGTPHRLLRAVVESNEARKEFIARHLVKDGARVIGLYRLSLKAGAEVVCNSSVEGVAVWLRSLGAEVLIYEPLLKTEMFIGFEVVEDKDEFFKRSDIVVSNRMFDEIKPYRRKVFTRDIFGIG